MCKNFRYYWTRCGPYAHGLCNGQLGPQVTELCAQVAADPTAYVEARHYTQNEERRLIDAMCFRHQVALFQHDMGPRPDSLDQDFVRVDPHAPPADTSTWIIPQRQWYNQQFRAVDWNPPPRPAAQALAMNEPPSPRTIPPTDPEVGVLHSTRDSPFWVAADGRPIVMLSTPDDPPRSTDRRLAASPTPEAVLSTQAWNDPAVARRAREQAEREAWEREVLARQAREQAEREAQARGREILARRARERAEREAARDTPKSPSWQPPSPTGRPRLASPPAWTPASPTRPTKRAREEPSTETDGPAAKRLRIKGPRRAASHATTPTSSTAAAAGPSKRHFSQGDARPKITPRFPAPALARATRPATSRPTRLRLRLTMPATSQPKLTLTIPPTPATARTSIRLLVRPVAPVPAVRPGVGRRPQRPQPQPQPQTPPRRSARVAERLARAAAPPPPRRSARIAARQTATTTPAAATPSQSQSRRAPGTSKPKTKAKSKAKPKPKPKPKPKGRTRK